MLADDRVALLEAGFADFDRVLAAAADHDVLVAQELPAQMLRHGPVIPLVALGAVVYGAVLFAVGGVDRDLIARLRG